MLKRIFFIFFASLLTVTPVSAALIPPPCPPTICPPPPPPTPDPVVVLPGIAGSRNLDLMIGGIFSNSWHLNGNSYHDLVNALIDAGYSTSTNLFIGFYDWRQDNAQSASDYLIPIIDEALQTTGKSKVDIIAHSMGGLVARSYIQSTGYRDDVDQLILLGTPNQGSSDSYLIWAGAQLPEDWSAPIRWLMNAYIGFLQLSTLPVSSRVEAIHNNIPSVGQLLPTYPFLYDPETQLTTELANPFLDSLNAGLGTLSTKVNDLIVIAGDDVGTINQISVEDRSLADSLQTQWEHGKPNPNPPAKDSTEGDNRALLSSSTIPGANHITISGGLHDRLPSLAQDAVIVALTGSHPAIVYNTPDPESVLGILVASPVEIEVTDQFGNIVSRALSQILGAEFDSETNPLGVKMILIPNPGDGEYSIKLTGIGDGGVYHLITGYADGDTGTSETKAGNIETGQIIEYNVLLTSDNNESPISTEIVDEAPPTATITQPQDHSTHIDTEIVQMELVSADRLSGIKESRLFLDGTLSAINTTTPTTTASIDLSLIPLGIHTIRGEADDNAGHSTSTEITLTSQTSFDATIQNIQHYEDLSLLTLKPPAKKFFIAQLKVAKALAEQYSQKPTPKLKTSINAILTLLTKEVQILERQGRIELRAAEHLKEAFEGLKVL